MTLESHLPLVDTHPFFVLRRPLSLHELLPRQLSPTQIGCHPTYPTSRANTESARRYVNSLGAKILQDPNPRSGSCREASIRPIAFPRGTEACVFISRPGEGPLRCGLTKCSPRDCMCVAQDSSWVGISGRFRFKIELNDGITGYWNSV